MWLKRHRRYSVTSNRRRRNKLSVTLCNLGVGATFGESILHDLPRDSTVVTKTTCELLRVEQQDFRLIFEKNKELMNDIITNCRLKNGFGQSMQTTSTVQTNVQQQPSPTKKQLSPDHPNPAAPITEVSLYVGSSMDGMSILSVSLSPRVSQVPIYDH
uniref:Cyclic nucleotide-binding domain-containing protein n=1 Tax=Anopheles minimus TaxID=112268 RepID=A0A182WJK2_9DIPT